MNFSIRPRPARSNFAHFPGWVLPGLKCRERHKVKVQTRKPWQGGFF